MMAGGQAEATTPILLDFDSVATRTREFPDETTAENAPLDGGARVAMSPPLNSIPRLIDRERLAVGATVPSLSLFF